LRETVSLAYQIVFAVGLRIEIAAGCELGLIARKGQLTCDGWNTGEKSNESVEEHRGECRV